MRRWSEQAIAYYVCVGMGFNDPDQDMMMRSKDLPGNTKQRQCACNQISKRVLQLSRPPPLELAKYQVQQQG